MELTLSGDETQGSALTFSFIQTDSNLNSQTAQTAVKGTGETSTVQADFTVPVDPDVTVPVDDFTAPVISTITSDAIETGILKVGDTITFTVTPSSTELGGSVTGSYNLQALLWSTADSGTTFTATYTVIEGEADQGTALQISGVTMDDAAGHTSASKDGVDIAKTIDANSPVFSSAITTSTSQIAITVNQDVTDNSASSSDFTLDGLTGGSIDSIVSVSGDVITLSIAGATISDLDTITISYAQSSGTFIDISGNILQNFDVESVTNNEDTDNVTLNVDTFTVVSDNSVSPNRAINGDIVTISFTADNNIESVDIDDVLVNADYTATAIETVSNGFTATYLISDNDAESELELEIIVYDKAGNSHTFTETSLTGDNVIIDRTAPEFNHAFLSGTHSLTVVYSESVSTENEDYTLIEVDDSGIFEIADSVIVYANNVLVKWIGDDNVATSTSGIEFTIETGVTDLAGNTLSSSEDIVIAASSNEDDMIITILSDGDGDGDAEIILSMDTFIEIIVVPMGIVPIVDVTDFDDAYDPDIISAVNDNPGATSAIFPSDMTITIQTNDASIEFPPSIQVLFLGDSETITIDISTKDPENDPEFARHFSNLDFTDVTIFEFGNADDDIIFNAPVVITIPELSGIIFSIDASGDTKQILACNDTVVDSDTADVFIDEIVGTNLIDGEACYTGDNIYTRHFSGYGYVSSSLSGGGGGSANEHLTRPTFGLSHNTHNPIVQCGFSWDNTCYDITDNWHTPFEKVDVTTGTYHMMTIKAYFEHPPLFIEFALVPELEAYHQSETKIEVLFENDFNNYYNDSDDDTITIKSIAVIQKDNLIDESLLSGTITKTPCGYVDSDWYELSIYDIMFREVPFFEKIAIQAADTARRTQITYLNEGFEIDGISLNPAKTAQITHHSKLGLFQVIQIDKFENLWSDEDGIIYTINNSDTWLRLTPISFERYQDTATNVPTRMHSDFYKIVDNEKKRAENIFLEKFGVTANLDVGTFTPMNTISIDFDNIQRDSSYFESYKQGQILLAQHALGQSLLETGAHAQYKELQEKLQKNKILETDLK